VTVRIVSTPTTVFTTLPHVPNITFTKSGEVKWELWL